MHAKGEIEVGELFVHESIIGSTFESRIVGTTTLGSRPAVVPSVAGQAWITYTAQVGMDPTDRFQNGFTLSDTWQEAVDEKLIKSRN
ncbi:proline racemase [Paraburkholderia fungorum]|nr:proline racemase family protein [Paraburkholderia fungorum]PRZ55831.1 proline racemase [Paraburkholderia fungorum]